MAKECINYFCSVEGLQEKLYLGHLQMLINNCSSAKFRVSIKTKLVGGGSPLVVCEKALRNFSFSSKDIAVKEGRVFAVFDYDFKDESFIKAIRLCKKEKILAAYSNVCFDLWLVLHKKHCAKKISVADGLVNDVRKAYKLDDDADIKDETIIDKILSQIDIAKIKIALKNSNEINLEREKDESFLNGNNGIFEQPYVNFVKLVEKILGDCELL